MKGKIVIAGMGHGGLAAAAALAAHGYDVTVLEQKSKGTLGYDWTDIFDPKAFAAAGLPMPDQKLYTYKEDMTFVNPSMTVRLRQHVPQDKREIKMERRRKIQALRAFIGHHDAQRDHLFHVCAR